VRDPKDTPIALAAIKAQVDYLVTNDKDLTAEDETTALLRTKIQPMTVGRFLKEVMEWSSRDFKSL